MALSVNPVNDAPTLVVSAQAVDVGAALVVALVAAGVPATRWAHAAPGDLVVGCDPDPGARAAALTRAVDDANATPAADVITPVCPFRFRSHEVPIVGSS